MTGAWIKPSITVLSTEARNISLYPSRCDADIEINHGV